MGEKLKLYNTLTRTTDVFEPLSKGEVKIYCCGPTVYNYQHIGNLRTYIFEDILVRTLRFAGYSVRHVMNITDVGHLVSDADEGEDKMALAAKRERKSSAEIAAYYTEIFFNHCALLNIQRPEIVCKAADHIQEMIELIKRLEAKGIAYESGGNVYLDITKVDDYGKLARLPLDQLQAGARIEVDSKKRNTLDFALWFTKSKFENQELQWDSPWGRGYPGWHIECSAMSMKYLGESFDIHCGGIDHIPVHHTNEIAQSEGATGKPFSRFWLHGGFLLDNNDKMSKSKGGFLTLDKLLERKIDPIAYRLFCFTSKYSQELSFSWESLEASINTLKKIKSTILSIKAVSGSSLQGSDSDRGNLVHSDPNNPQSQVRQAQSNQYSQLFNAALFDDLNMPRAIAVLHQLLSDSSLASADKLCLLYKFDQVLGLGIETWEEGTVEIPAAVLTLLEGRQAARKAKDFKLADELRDKILAQGFVIEDSATGPKLKRQS
ncbi:cysteine--tRNA ligase [bacterium]|nr:cysteine--tRNA ligase [bacterium]